MWGNHSRSAVAKYMQVYLLKWPMSVVFVDFIVYLYFLNLHTISIVSSKKVKTSKQYQAAQKESNYLNLSLNQEAQQQ